MLVLTRRRNQSIMIGDGIESPCCRSWARRFGSGSRRPETCLSSARKCSSRSRPRTWKRRSPARTSLDKPLWMMKDAENG